MKKILLYALLSFNINSYAVSGYPFNYEMLLYSYNSIELKYDSDLPEHAPYPKTRAELISLIKKADNNDLISNYTLFSFFYNPCYLSKRPNDKTNVTEACGPANYYLYKTLSIDSEHVLALYHRGYILENGYGIERDKQKSLHYYDKAYHIGKNKILIACDKLFSKYLNGDNGVDQNIAKAKEYAVIAAKNGSDKYKKYIDNWDYIIFTINTQKEISLCIKQGDNISSCIKNGNDTIKNFKNNYNER